MIDADKKLLELAERATPRPWHMHEGDLVTQDHQDVYWAEDDAPDAEYIVATANAVPRLIAEKERLLDQRDKALARVEALRTALLNVYCLRSTRRLMGITCDDRPDEGKCHVCAALAADDAAKKSSDV